MAITSINYGVTSNLEDYDFNSYHRYSYASGDEAIEAALCRAHHYVNSPYRDIEHENEYYIATINRTAREYGIDEATAASYEYDFI